MKNPSMINFSLKEIYNNNNTKSKNTIILCKLYEYAVPGLDLHNSGNRHSREVSYQYVLTLLQGSN